MKKIRLLLLLFIIGFVHAKGQVTIEDFSNSSCPVSAPPSEPQNYLCVAPNGQPGNYCYGFIEEDCLTNWFTTHGRPMVRSITGSKRLHLSAQLETDNIYKTQGAAYFYEPVFRKDNCYKIVYKYRWVNEYSTLELDSNGNPLELVNQPTTLEVSVNSGLEPANIDLVNNDDCFGLSQAAPLSQVVDINNSEQYISSNSFRTTTIFFRADNDYRELYFNVVSTLEEALGNPCQVMTVMIDDIEIEKLNNCSTICSGCKANIPSIAIGELETTTYLSDIAEDINDYECYSIAGQLIIDENNVYFYDKDFVMAPGAEIIIADGINTSFDNCTFESCFQMWKGIRQEGNSQLIFRNNVIKDAQYALQLNGNVTYQLKDNIFENNYVGFYLNNDFAVANQLGGIVGNQFITTAELKSPFFSQSPLPYIPFLSYAGILVRRANNISVGIPGVIGSNTFDELLNGILIFECPAANIYLNSFQNIYGSGPFDLPILPPDYENLGGRSIYAVNSNIRVINNSFNDGSFGIDAIECSMLVAFNSFDGATVAGVQYDGNGIGVNNIQIFHNVINESFSGIKIYDLVTPLSNSMITNNQISTSLALSVGYLNVAGILISNSGEFISNDNLLDIEGNSITLTGSMPGVILNNTNNCHVKSNTISSNIGLQFAEGIHVLSGENNEIVDNIINGATNNFPSPLYVYSCIEVEDSPNNLFCCNSLSDGLEGLTVKGACSETKIVNTEFNNHSIGLFYESNSVTGPQEFRGNIWSSNNNVDAEYETPSFLSAFSIYKMSPNLIPGDFSPNNWFISELGSDTGCNTSPFCNDELLFSPDINELDSYIIENGLDTDFEEGTNQMLIRTLFKKMNNNPEMLNSNDVALAFYQDNVDSGIGSLFDVSSSMHESAKPSSELKNELLTKWNTLDSGLEELGELDYEIFNASNSELPSLLIERELLKNGIVDNATIYQSKISQKITDRIDDVENQQLMNSTIVTESIPSAVDKVVHDLQLTFLSNGYLTDVEIVVLWDKAILCPKKYGGSVYDARALYYTVTKQSSNWSELEDCVSSRNTDFGIGIEKNIHGLDLILSPNPTQSDVSIFITKMPEESVILSVLDVYGNIVMQDEYLAKEYQLNTNKLISGVYFVNVKPSINSRGVTKKLIVQH